MINLNIFIVCGAPFIGSFIGCFADRLPQNKRIFFSRSHCTSCSKRLSPGELVPLLSWMLQAGKCRTCLTSLTFYYPSIELAALAIAIWGVSLDGDVSILSVALGWMLLALAAMDLRHQILADVLTLPLLVTGLLFVPTKSVYDPMDHVLGAIAGAGALYVVNVIYRHLRKRDGLGFGDVKLLAAAGAWLTWRGVSSVVLYASLAALAVILLQSLLGKVIKSDQRIPFGAYLCLGFWGTWLYGPITFGTAS